MILVTVGSGTLGILFIAVGLQYASGAGHSKFPPVTLRSSLLSIFDIQLRARPNELFVSSQCIIDDAQDNNTSVHRTCVVHRFCCD